MKQNTNGYLTALAKKIVPTKAEKERVRKSIAHIRKTIKKEVKEVKETFVFGSYDRGTMIRQRFDPRADADLMIVFDRISEYKPQTYLTRLRKFINGNTAYKKSLSKQSSPAVVLKLHHIALELVPGYYNYENLYIPDNNSSKSFFSSNWQKTDPKLAKTNLTRANVQGKSVIKPAIRLIKYWNALNGYIYQSYYLENYVVNQIYWSAPNLKGVLYNVVKGLPTYELSEKKRKKVEHLKSVISAIEDLDRRGLDKESLPVLKKIFPPVK